MGSTAEQGSLFDHKDTFGVDPKAGEDLDEQYTPSSFFDPLDEEFGFDLDPCCTPESAKCKRYFTKKDNGLLKSWKGRRVFMNPPYSQIAAWLTKATYEVKHNGCIFVAALLPAWTDRAWWHKFIEPHRARRHGGFGYFEVRFIKGRIIHGCKGNPEGTKKMAGGKKRGGGKFASVLVIFGGQ